MLVIGGQMNARKTKRNRIAEDLKALRLKRKCAALVRRSTNGHETDLPPRIRTLVAAAVRVWELKRGLHVAWRDVRAYQS